MPCFSVLYISWSPPTSLLELKKVRLRLGSSWTPKANSYSYKAPKTTRVRFELDDRTPKATGNLPEPNPVASGVLDTCSGRQVKAAVMAGDSDSSSRRGPHVVWVERNTLMDLLIYTYIWGSALPSYGHRFCVRIVQCTCQCGSSKTCYCHTYLRIRHTH